MTRWYKSIAPSNVLFVCVLLAAVAGTGYRMFATPKDDDIQLPSRPVNNSAALQTGALLVGPSRLSKHGVVIVEWSDFQCPFCAKTAVALQELRQRYKGRLTILFRYLPLPIHKDAYAAALAGTCADEQGRFPAMHDILFASQAQLGIVPWEQFGSLAHVKDSLQFRSCIRSRRHADIIERDLDVADSLRITGTPALVINGKLFTGAVPEEQLEAEISAALK